MSSIRDEIIRKAEESMALKQETENALRETQTSKTPKHTEKQSSSYALPLPPFNMPRAVFYLMTANILAWMVLYIIYLVDQGETRLLPTAVVFLFTIPIFIIGYFIRWIIAYLDYAFFWPIRVILWLLISLVTVSALMMTVYSMLTGAGFPAG